jgi:hypothetical protein
MVYGTTDKNAFYKQSKDDGMSWSTAIKLNEGPGPTAGMVTTTMGERGPKISVSPDGSIHVIWMDLWAAGVNTYARAVHSLDDGNTFSAPVAASDQYGIDGVNLAAAGDGNVFAFWHWISPGSPIPNATSATWLRYALSEDNGASFKPSVQVEIDGGMEPIACSMCMTSTSVTADGIVNLAFRYFSCAKTASEHNPSVTNIAYQVRDQQCARLLRAKGLRWRWQQLESWASKQGRVDMAGVPHEWAIHCCWC